MYPLEPAAGMDMVAARKKYGSRLGIKGGIDKFVLRRSKNDIIRELEYKICDETKGGGTVFALDHLYPMVFLWRTTDTILKKPEKY